MLLTKLKFLFVILGLTVTVLEAVPAPDPTPKKKDEISEKYGGYDPPGLFDDFIDRRIPPGYQKMLDAKEKERRNKKMRDDSNPKRMQNKLDKTSNRLQPDLRKYNGLISLIQKRIDMIHTFIRNYFDQIMKIKARIPPARMN